MASQPGRCTRIIKGIECVTPVITSAVFFVLSLLILFRSFAAGLNTVQDHLTVRIHAPTNEINWAPNPVVFPPMPFYSCSATLNSIHDRSS
jgi:hypothetical protein